MKVIGTILKIVTALAAVAGAIYVIATYGDKIVTWAKNLLSDICYCDECDCDECCCCEECCQECAPDEEAPVEEAAVQAEEADFEG